MEGTLPVSTLGTSVGRPYGALRLFTIIFQLRGPASFSFLILRSCIKSGYNPMYRGREFDRRDNTLSCRFSWFVSATGAP